MIPKRKDGEWNEPIGIPMSSKRGLIGNDRSRRDPFNGEVTGSMRIPGDSKVKRRSRNIWDCKKVFLGIPKRDCQGPYWDD